MTVSQLPMQIPRIACPDLLACCLPKLCDAIDTDSVLCFMIGTGLRIAIVHARWNTKIIDALVSGAVKSLISTGVSRDNIVIQTVPGSYELPVAVQKLVHYLTARSFIWH